MPPLVIEHSVNWRIEREIVEFRAIDCFHRRRSNFVILQPPLRIIYDVVPGSHLAVRPIKSVAGIELAAQPVTR